MNKVFDALASAPRRKILAYLAEVDLTAGEIAARFDMSKPAISKHLQILENAGLVTSEKRGQFVHYALVTDNLVNTLHGFKPAGELIEFSHLFGNDLRNIHLRRWRSRGRTRSPPSRRAAPPS